MLRAIDRKYIAAAACAFAFSASMVTAQEEGRRQPAGAQIEKLRAILEASNADVADQPNGWRHYLEAAKRVRELDERIENFMAKGPVENYPDFSLLYLPGSREAQPKDYELTLQVFPWLEEHRVFEPLHELMQTQYVAADVPRTSEEATDLFMTLGYGRRLTQMLLASAALAIEKQDDAATINYVELALAVARSATAHPLWINAMVRASHDTLIGEFIKFQLSESRLSREMIIGILGAMDRQDRPFTARMIMTGEYHYAVLHVDGPAFNADGVIVLRRWIAHRSEDSDALHKLDWLPDVGLSMNPRTWLSWLMMQEPVDWFGWLFIDRDTFFAKLDRLMEDEIQRLESGPRPLTLRSPVIDAHLDSWTWRDMPLRIFYNRGNLGYESRTEECVDDSTGLISNYYLARSERAALRLQLNIELYRFRTGTVPDSLDQLVPEYLQSVPMDLFTGKPYGYRPARDEREASAFPYVLYSFGQDGIDDDGAFEEGSSFFKSWGVPKGFDINLTDVWSVADRE